MKWSDNDVSELKNLWLTKGKTMLEISRHFGVSRSAISGRLRRLGLVGAERNKAALSPRQKRKIGEIKPMRSVAKILKEPASIVVTDDGGPVGIMELRRHHCRFIEGDPRDSDKPYCGQRVKEEGSAYCPYHYAIVYRPAKAA